MKKVKWLVIIILLASFSIYAEEGMWLLTQLDQLDLEKKGLDIKLTDLYHPTKSSLTDAIVSLGGCTASFVSPDGLILTNHHCAYGALQRASTKDQDYITNGFLAKSRSEEIEARGTTASVLLKMKDVTKKVLKAAKGITDPLIREKKIDAKIVEMTEEIEGDREDLSARVASMYNGKQYILFVFKRYQDVRIVYAPPLAIGKYGGDIDNWIWPRHTGDFTYLRAYMAPDGSGAKYSPNNIPVNPKNYLRIARGPLKEGDFTFILGFPGATTRWRTSNSVAWNLKYNYPETINNYQDIINLLDELTRDSPEGKIRVASSRAGYANTMKNYQGKVDGMTRTNFLQKKIDFEKELMAFIDNDPELKKEYGDVLTKIKHEYDILAETKEKDDALGLFGSAGMMASLASQAYHTARERAKPEGERNPNFTEKGVERTVERLHLRYYSYYEPTDKAMLKRVLDKVNGLSATARLQGLEFIFKNAGKSINDFINDAYASSKLTDVDYTKSLFSKSVQELEQLNDPFINMAAQLYDDTEAQRKRNEKFNANMTALRKKYLDALYAWKGTGLYPDANGTIRCTYGHVAGYQPADAVTYYPFTTLTGVVEKNTGKEPFDMPARLGQLFDNKDYGQWLDPELDDVPVAFTHRCDITGGNSGSPVMNAKGELVGLAFDGNYEAMTSDWQYDFDIQRTISVDIRYVMFITEKFAKADYLLREMGVK